MKIVLYVAEENVLNSNVTFHFLFSIYQHHISLHYKHTTKYDMIWINKWTVKYMSEVHCPHVC